ncbi:MAG: UDP-N-acetylmuramate dehydrogenase [Deltaproteobacteria bacterium]|nr:UDP-N-acetylmuramate dehydrogenase [Deltaproteobacteria bacterium]
MSSLSLRTFTTIKIGGSAERILKLKDLHELQEPLPQPIRVLGNGSNILIDDEGLKGTVIVVRDFPPSEPEILEDTKEAVTLKVSGGNYLPTLCRWASRHGLSGCEYMVGVPGTVGGAIVQNAGANEQEMSQILISADVLDLKTQKLKTYSAAEAKLTYRHSSFKEKEDQLIVSAKIRLQKKPTPQIEAQISKNLAYRKEKTPYAMPSLGSIFTRLPGANKDEWIYPGKLIEDAGLKDFQIGGAQVSKIHANYIVNTGDATFDDVLALIEEVEKIVFESSGVKLQREILIWSDRD